MYVRGLTVHRIRFDISRIKSYFKAHGPCISNNEITSKTLKVVRNKYIAIFTRIKNVCIFIESGTKGKYFRFSAGRLKLFVKEDAQFPL